jgi:CheY-like chemotaxis protein
MTRRKILVVEDEAVVARDVQTTITRCGHEAVGWAATAAEALELAEETSPDLVLMDIRLQGEGDGVSAAEEVRRRFDIPVVFVTAFADEATLDRAKAAGPYGFVVKPFSEVDLRVAIEIAVNKHDLDREIARAQRERAEESEFLAALFETIPASVMVVDGNQKVRMVNRALERADLSTSASSASCGRRSPRA